jgi:hypothetical protein
MRILEGACYYATSVTKLYEGVMQVWPVPLKPTCNLKALEPIGRELRTVGKVMSLSLLFHNI